VSDVPRLVLEVPEAAEALGIGQTKLRELISRGEIPVWRCGRRTVLPVDALRRWLDQQTEWPGTSPHPFTKGLSVG
jgi:excisionase family DNA binding protein